VRILRLRLKDFRGVEEHLLEFSPDGVTVIEGPNEIGKSSVAEALDLIFRWPAESQHREVRAVRPRHRDADPEVEIEAELGEFRFTYLKRFHKGSRGATELRFTQPSRAPLTGREAHEWAWAKLDETVNVALWNGLRVRQDTAVEQAPLDGSERLRRALSESSGSEPGESGDGALFQAVEAEQARYFTATGKPGKPLQEAQNAEAVAFADLSELRGRLADLERDVERVAHLERQVDHLVRQLDEDQRKAQERLAEIDRLKEREGQVERLNFQLKAARMQESAAEKAARDRKQQLERLTEASKRQEQLDARAARDRPLIEMSEQQVGEAARERADAEGRAREAETLVDLRERDMSYRSAVLDLELMEKRKRHIDQARQEASEARALLDKAKVTEERLAAIEALSNELIRAEAQLAAGSPRLRVKSKRALEFELDGETLRLEAGQVIERRVPDESRLDFPDHAEVTIAAGTSVDQLAETRERKLLALDRALADAGVTSVAEAREMLQRRERAEQVLSETEVRIRDELHSIESYDRMLEKLGNLRRLVADYPGQRVEQPAMAADFDDANRLKREAREGSKRAAKRAADARATHEERERHLTELRAGLREASVEREIATREVGKAEADLEQARTQTDDADLEIQLTKAREGARSAETVYAQAKQELAEAEPARARQLATNARETAAQTADRLRESEDEQTRLRERLQLLGGHGLFDAVQEAEARHVRLERDHRTMLRRAAAARLLFETMGRAKQEMQRRYVTPLREKIVQLGRFVFDETLDVEVDETLRIRTRSLDGVTLPFEDLSVGAQEQLSLVARLACATLIAKDGGVPLILDDTLGHSDPERLEGLGAMLSHAARSCQVIVLTCSPDRFRHIGDARIIRI